MGGLVCHGDFAILQLVDSSVKVLGTCPCDVIERCFGEAISGPILVVVSKVGRYRLPKCLPWFSPAAPRICGCRRSVEGVETDLMCARLACGEGGGTIMETNEDVI